MARILNIYNLNSTFDFGSNGGKTIAEILSINEEYIQWCIINVDWFCISDECFSKFFLLELSKISSYYKNKVDSLREINDRKITECIKLASYEEKYSSEYEYDDYYNNNDNWLIDAAGCDDPEVMNDVYWNLD